MESCKLLDFDKNLSKRPNNIKKNEPAAAGGTGREFINVDELIQNQISEGCHGIDAFAAPNVMVD